VNCPIQATRVSMPSGMAVRAEGVRSAGLRGGTSGSRMSIARREAVRHTLA